MLGGGAPPPPAVAKLRAEPNLSTATIASLNDDLLLEVLLRLPSLPALIRSVLTCRSWLRAVRSSPEFRRRFRALHPDHMLGIFIDCDGPAVPGTPGFASADSLTGDDPDPDLAAALRGGNFTLDSLMQVEEYASPGWHAVDCRGGYLLLLNPFDRRDGSRLPAAVFSSKTWDWIIHPWIELAGDGKLAT
uniref:F-box domain-containing protein n=1 Tax=Oryza brachyantha TaxID=4533 RepID=J3LB71_ORYBR